MRPTLRQPSWLVYTSSEIIAPTAMDGESWGWVAYGPRGSESGIERSAAAALGKAHAASVLVAEEGIPR